MSDVVNEHEHQKRVNFVTKTRRQLTAVFVFASVAIPALTYKSISENIVKFNTCFDFATKLDSTEANNLLTRLQNEANNTFGQNSKLSLKFKIDVPEEMQLPLISKNVECILSPKNHG